MSRARILSYSFALFAAFTARLKSITSEIFARVSGHPVARPPRAVRTHTRLRDSRNSSCPPSTASPKVLPTEMIGFHAVILMVPLSAYLCDVGRTGWICNIVFVFLAIASYWLVLLRFRRPRILLSLWQTQVLDRTKSRFSVGVIVQLADALHMLMFFASMLLIITNLIYRVERPIWTWSSSLSATLAAASVRGLTAQPAFHALTPILFSVAWLVGVVVTALWVAIFMRSFNAVFHMGETEAEAGESPSRS